MQLQKCHSEICAVETHLNTNIQDGHTKKPAKNNGGTADRAVI